MYSPPSEDIYIQRCKLSINIVNIPTCFANVRLGNHINFANLFSQWHILPLTSENIYISTTNIIWGKYFLISQIYLFNFDIWRTCLTLNSSAIHGKLLCKNFDYGLMSKRALPFLLLQKTRTFGYMNQILDLILFSCTGRPNCHYNA